MPDGLYKGRIHLSKDMMPGVGWSGASIKVSLLGHLHVWDLTERFQYYLDVTVLFGGDASRACIPIRVI